MKLKTITMVLMVLGISLLFSGFGGEENSDYPSGAPAGYTGSPGDGQDCHNCHGGSASSVTGWITSDIPAQGYTPGSTYTITVTVTGSGTKGFEVSPQNVSGTLLGTLIAGTGTQLKGSGKYVTHSSSASTNPKIWTFQWVAPAAGTGNVTFYGAFTVTKPVTKLSTLEVVESVVPLSVIASANPSTINQGESSQLTATASGGSGSYTYSWTSDPAGYTSNQQNPTVTPVITTTYTVQVSDGSTTASANTTVTVVIPVPLAVVATANPMSVAPGQASQLNALASGGSGTYSYSWTSDPAGFVSNLQNPVVYPTITTTYTVSVSDGSSTVTDDVQVIVTANPLLLNVTATPSMICTGQSSQLNAYPSGGSGSYTYSWTSNPPGYNATIANPVASPTQTTMYIVVVFDGAITITDSAQVVVSQDASAFAGNDTTCNVNVTQIQLNGNASNYSSLLWTTSGDGTFDDTGVPDAVYYPGPNDRAAMAIDLTLTAYSVSPCTMDASDDVHIILDATIGINDASIGAEMILFPNPAHELLNITFEGSGEIIADLTLIDFTGRSVIFAHNAAIIPQSGYRLDVAGLARGVYFLRVKMAESTVTRKIILN